MNVAVGLVSGYDSEPCSIMSRVSSLASTHVVLLSMMFEYRWGFGLPSAYWFVERGIPEIGEVPY